jgi:uncharacterized membrane protein
MRKWLPLLIVLAAIITSAIVYPQLPARVPTHWNAAGQVNGYSARFWGAWLIPLFLVGMWAIMWILPAIDPRGSKNANFKPPGETNIIALCRGRDQTGSLASELHGRSPAIASGRRPTASAASSSSPED